MASKPSCLRSMHSKKDSKNIAGHHVHADVKAVMVKGIGNKVIQRLQ